MKTKVLVVEDDKWLAEQHERVLKTDYEVKISLSAISAIGDIDDFHPDVIILDVLLVGNTAFTLLNELKSHSDIGSIPIILCTNLASDIEISDVSHYGVKRILDKALMEPGDLVGAVRSVT
jgi:DNA-binding response OmpR family regulator